MMGMIGFLLAAFAAYWVYTDAKEHGYGSGAAAGWAIGTFLLLIVFLPVYLIFGRRGRLKYRQEQNDPDIIDVTGTVVEDTFPCKMCGGKVKEEFSVCPYCGFSLRPKCKSCEREMERSWTTCPYCQTPASK